MSNILNRIVGKSRLRPRRSLPDIRLFRKPLMAYRRPRSFLLKSNNFLMCHSMHPLKFWWILKYRLRLRTLRTLRSLRLCYIEVLHMKCPAYTRHRKFRLKNNNLRFDHSKCPIESQPILIHMCHFRRLHTPRNPRWLCRSALDRAGFPHTMHRVYTLRRKFRLKNSSLQFDRNKCLIGFLLFLKHTRHLRRLRTLRNPCLWCKPALDRAGFPHTMRPAYTRHRKFRLKNTNLRFDRNKCPIESQPILIHMCRFRRLHTPRNPRWLCRSALDRAGFLRRTRSAYTRHRKFRLKNSSLRFDHNKCPIGFLLF